MGIKAGCPMRMYSPEELDVMAEAYVRVLDLIPAEKSSTTEITLRLVQEIAAGVANGVRDEDALASAALERTNMAAAV
jgi:hypothetical protein